MYWAAQVDGQSKNVTRVYFNNVCFLFIPSVKCRQNLGNFWLAQVRVNELRPGTEGVELYTWCITKIYHLVT